MSKTIYFLLAVLLWNINPSSAQDTETVMDKLTQGLGGEAAIEEARYLMFSCKPLQQKETSGLHNYLYDFENGDVRFEGTTKNDKAIVALFNFITQKGSVFIDNKKEEDQESLLRIVEYFKQDSYWILSPILLGSNKVSVQVNGSQIKDSKRYFTLNAELPNSPFSKNIIFVDAITGVISFWQTFDQKGTKSHDFVCLNHKDIGGGLKLPTKFTDLRSGFIIQYPVIAALVNIETTKFKAL